ncbi:MAG: SIMPL domain-containing protein [Dehalococcoidales bacterium]|nr:SIMPL domain-containing protein [Dehalococcoidales bacterium]
MKRIAWITGCLLLIVMAIGATGCDSFSPPSTSTGNEPSGSQASGIWVNGTGEVTVTPDISILQVGVEAQEDTVAGAMTRATEAMAKIGQAITERGIEDRDIQTHYFNIQQRTRRDNINDEEVITGYRVANKMTVKIRVLPVESYTLDWKASLILDAVVKAGGDLIRIDSFSFSVEDPTVYYDEAREKATADAKAKAEKLAKQTGVRLGEPTFVSESVYTPSSYSMSYGLSGGVPAPVPVVIESVPPTSMGETQITLTVQVAYSIR